VVPMEVPQKERTLEGLTGEQPRDAAYARTGIEDERGGCAVVAQRNARRIPPVADECSPSRRRRPAHATDNDLHPVIAPT
jgi:hypothetical protein